jgi:hypothetical protein
MGKNGHLHFLGQDEVGLLFGCFGLNQRKLGQPDMDIMEKTMEKTMVQPSIMGI